MKMGLAPAQVKLQKWNGTTTTRSDQVKLCQDLDGPAFGNTFALTIGRYNSESGLLCITVCRFTSSIWAH
jgi:hypothetical protein